jgi:LPXTG-motif cell wall-anchored protein
MTVMAREGRRTGRRGTAVIAAGCLVLGALALPDSLIADDPVPADPSGTAPVVVEPPPDPGDTPTDPPAEDPTAPPTTPPETTPPTTPEAPPQPPEEATVALAAPSKASQTVSMTDGRNTSDYGFSPTTITINVGDSVTWTNTGDQDHNAVGTGGSSFDTGIIDPGGSGSATFDKAGSFPYVCTLHASLMKGTVVVNGDTSSGGGKGGDTPTTPTDTSGTSGTSGTSPTSEAAATSSPDAAGTSTSLPMTGSNELAATLLGVALMGAGLLLRALVRRPG